MYQVSYAETSRDLYNPPRSLSKQLSLNLENSEKSAF